LVRNIVVWPQGSADTVCTCLHARTQLHRPLLLTVAVESMLHLHSNFKVGRTSLSVDIIHFLSQQ